MSAGAPAALIRKVFLDRSFNNELIFLKMRTLSNNRQTIRCVSELYSPQSFVL